MVEVTLTFEAHPEQVPFFLALYRVLTRPQDTDDRNGPAIEADRDKLLASLPLAVTELAIRVEAVLKEYPTRYGPAARALLEHLAGTTLPLPPSTANPDPQKELRERLTELFPEKKGPLLARTKKTLLRAIKYADDLDAPDVFLRDRGQAGGAVPRFR